MAPDVQPQFLPSACPHDCPSTCALEVERLSATRIGRIRGAAANSFTAGVVCAKVARYAERAHHPDRLCEPLERVGDKGVGRGAFRPMPWDEALDRVADALASAAARHGPQTVWPYFYAGTMGLVQRDGVERLRHAMGYSRFRQTICVALADAGWLAGAGVKWGADSREMADADMIVVWGANPAHTQVNTMTHITRARKNRGARLVVVDPYRNATAQIADLHLALRPGTDAALACAVMHVAFRDGYADWDYMRQYTDDPDGLAAHVATRGPDWAAAISGLGADQIEAFAKLYGQTQRTFLRLGYGFSRARNGSQNMHAASCLAAVMGSWRHKGGGALYANGTGPNFFYAIDKTLIEGLDKRDLSIRELDQSRIGAVLTGDGRGPSGGRGDLGDGPPVTALFIQNTNPVAVCPDSHAVRRGFMRDDLFVCVHEQFMTETAAMADIVLPATTFLEHDDVYVSGGHTHLHVVKAVIEPHKQCRSNHAVVCALAKRLGAEHRGFAMSAWEIIDETLKASNLPGADDVRAARWLDLAKPFEEAHFLNGFGHADGKFHFRADWASVGHDPDGLSPWPDHVDIYDAADDQHPFRLVTAPARQFLNTSFTETPTSRQRQGRPTVMMHPHDCRRLGLAAGARARIGNTLGDIVVHVEPFEGLQTGVLIIESVWPGDAFEGGVGVNALVSADPGKPRGGAVFHDTAVWARRA